ncbi:MAG: inorganic phosphate transporter [Proteobacteria bacterium]|nr:inorganic phosphate transporter [Pseudomonadota bacterium]
MAFSGKGIVPQDVASSLPFMLSVGFAAALTVAMATRAGLPISTTHALLGGLVGAGFGAVASNVHVSVAVNEMLLPLLLSPMIALLLALLVVPLIGRIRARGRQTQVCACVDTIEAVATAGGPQVADAKIVAIGFTDQPECAPAPDRTIVAVDATSTIDRLHLFTAVAVSFARGLNDTPKIAAAIVAVGALGAAPATTLVVVAMAAGGLLAARRVAETMAFRVTAMDPGQGLGANLVTSFLVIGASHLGMPVSTTHVAAGSLFGIAASQGGGHSKVIRNIVLAWLLTLPVAAVFAYASYFVLAHF